MPEADEPSREYGTLIGRYLIAVGVLNLMLTNPLGFLLIWFGVKVRHHLNVYRRLTIGLCWIHLAIIVSLLFAAFRGVKIVYGGLCLPTPIELPSWAVCIFLGLLGLLHLLPIHLLMHPVVREQFEHSRSI